MELKDIFSIWNKLTAEEQHQLSMHAVRRTVQRGTIIHNGCATCTGLLAVCSGQLRAYFLSDEGREVTLYRLFDLDVCMLAAPCIMRSIRFDIVIAAEKETELLIIPPGVYKHVMEQSAPLANYTNEIMAARFSEVMWLMEQIMWRSLDKRLASFLLEEASLENTGVLKITHEAIGNHMGTAREVITRMLRYFQSEGMVRLTRGAVEITDQAALKALADE